MRRYPGAHSTHLDVPSSLHAPEYPSAPDWMQSSGKIATSSLALYIDSRSRQLAIAKSVGAKSVRRVKTTGHKLTYPVTGLLYFQ